MSGCPKHAQQYPHTSIDCIDCTRTELAAALRRAEEAEQSRATAGEVQRRQHEALQRAHEEVQEARRRAVAEKRRAEEAEARAEAAERRAEEAEAGAAALREALEKYDGVHASQWWHGVRERALASDAGRSLLERLRVAEKGLLDLRDAVSAESGSVEESIRFARATRAETVHQRARAESAEKERDALRKVEHHARGVIDPYGGGDHDDPLREALASLDLLRRGAG